MIAYKKIIPLLSILYIGCSDNTLMKQDIFNAQGEIAGEVTQNSVILQSRLTANDTLINGDIPGKNGIARFEWSENEDFSDSKTTRWLNSTEENDFIIKTRIANLIEGTKYHYRLRYGKDTINTFLGNTRSFRTLPHSKSDQPVDFIVTSCFNYYRFHYGRLDDPNAGYQGEDRHLGYPGLSTITSLNPDFVVFTGDNVYYDTPQTESLRAKTQSELRKKWHEQFIQPRFIELFSKTATYWEKDDHDHRFNDSDTITNFVRLAHLMANSNIDSTGLDEPSHQLGIKTFREQVPVIDPENPDAVTYRTYRINKHLQIWFTENRDYRSPNAMQDGPGKSIWGEQQKIWLKHTLLDSDADFKILISPGPLIGPDDAYKNDNHVNHNGFRHEGQDFLNWTAENRSKIGNFYIVHGDRHWQYHSVDPHNIEEFSVGAIDDSNARMPRLPGDPKSTDPKGKIKQPYVASKVSGGFLRIRTNSNKDNGSLQFTFYDQKGKVLYKMNYAN